MSAPRFQELAIKRVSPEAAGAVAITFAIPEAERERFAFEPGQFLTLRATIDGQDVRRNYSISSPRSRLAREGELEIGIRPVEGGLFSNWATRAIKAGDTLQVMPPDGRFVVKKKRAIHRVGFAAGSGITPILSIAASTLEEQPDSKFTLIYGNRRQASTMFREEIEDLKNRYLTRLALHHVFSREPQDAPIAEGRITRDKLAAFLGPLIDPRDIDEVFVCGPHEMNDAAEAALLAAGVAAERIHIERFGFGAPLPGAAPLHPVLAGDAASARLSVIRDGQQREVDFIEGDASLLDAAARAGLDVPYSCKSGVCSTCRAKLLEGKVRMDRNFALDKRELDAGFILSCQAHPLTERVTISFDER